MKRLNYEQAATYLGIVTADGRPKVGTLRSMVCRKQIPHIRLSDRIVVFDQDALDAFVASKTVLTRIEERELGENGGGQ